MAYPPSFERAILCPFRAEEMGLLKQKAALDSLSAPRRALTEGGSTTATQTRKVCRMLRRQDTNAVGELGSADR
jgi:hypothetical protein